jgi:GDP-6-deoxy-D-talose 4-dehydrogenase
LSQNALITGIAGFTGRYMAAELARAGYRVYGLSNNPLEADMPEVAGCHVCNLLDGDGVTAAIAAVRPDVVVHLAAIASVVHSDVEDIYRTNVIGTRHLLDRLAVAAHRPRAVLLASSANIYGNGREGVLDEDTPAAPANDYAVSKLAMEYVARLFAGSLPIIIARPFNYTGIGQDERFLLPKIVAHMRRQAEIIELGNIDVARDFSDVRTVVRCYRALLEAPQAPGGTFNICSGTAYSLSEVIAMAEEIAGHKITVRVNPAFVRANEVRRLLGSRARLEAMIGPVPNIPLDETLRWMLGAGA